MSVVKLSLITVFPFLNPLLASLLVGQDTLVRLWLCLEGNGQSAQRNAGIRIILEALLFANVLA